MKKTKIKKAHFGLYNTVIKYETVFSFGESDEELIRKLKKYLPQDELNIEFWTDSVQGYCRIFNSGFLLIRLRELPNSCESYGVLAHEIFHSVELSLNRKGFSFNKNKPNETMAYCIQWTTENCYKKLNKYY